MSEAERPNPDEILARMKREETAAARGKLKIFFGMSPGVGKTYAMLQAARQKQGEGCEVVVGIVETHGRKETEGLLEGMPIMPRTQIEYRGTRLEEMDLDAILTWHPGLAVVDELVHKEYLTEAAIKNMLTGDLYVSLGEPVDGGAWSVRVYHKPFVTWIWGGCLLMALGGLLALSDRRYRGAARRDADALAAGAAVRN